MADRRKLQNEIDRTLKKVDEGVKLFQELWEKVQNAPNTNQKEKFESELKKEIKKLQRLRDQIKTWITSGDIKDKKSLIEARKLIEAQMERFKVVEKETKTKAYSKEGLGSVQKMDPAQREREELIGWLSGNIDQLKVLVDACESEIETIQMMSKKKKLERDKQDRVDKLKYSLDRHAFHIGRLEAIMRLLDNEAIDMDQVKSIKDDVDYYVQSNGEPDFEENENMYDDLDIDDNVIPDAASVGGMASTNTDDGEETGSPLALTSSGGLHNHAGSSHGSSNNNNNINHSPVSSSSTSPSPTPSLSTVHSSNKLGRQQSTSLNRHNSGGSGPNSTSRQQQQPAMSITPLKQQSSFEVASHSTTANAIKRNKQLQPPSASDVNIPTVVIRPSTVPERSSSVGPESSSTTNSTAANPPPSFPYNFAAVAAQGSSSNGTRGAGEASEHSPHSLASSHASSSLMTSPSEGFHRTDTSQQPEIVIKSGSQVGGLLTTATSNSDVNSSSTTNPGISFAFKASQSVSSTQPPPQPIVGRSSQPTSTVSTPSSSQTSSSQAAALFAAVSSHYSSNSLPSWSASDTVSGAAVSTATSVVGSLLPPASSGTTQGGLRSTRISARQGISPLGKVQLRHDQVWQRKMVEAALSRVPMVGDSERVRHYLPRQPCASPVYYPSQAVESSTSIEFYKRLNVDSLFFVFYFMEGTKAQLLAAQALKDLAWRFHTRELTWFQRAETPKEVTESHEMGTYLFFDTQRWQTRKRENFRFEYQFLEDRNLNSYLEAADQTAQAAIAANSSAATAALMMAAAASGTNAAPSTTTGAAAGSNGPTSVLTGAGGLNATVQQAGQQQAVAAGGRK